MTASNLQSESCSAIYPYVLLSTYRLLVCQVCGFASVADEVATHLRTRHRDIQPEHRQGLVEKVNQIQNIIRNQDELRNLRYPTNTIEPIPYLAPPKPDGLKCRACGYIVRHVQKIQKHCAEKHQWINPRGRGRPAPNCHVSAHETPWEEHVACQRFFPTRAGSRWFQVNTQTGLQDDVRKSTHTNSSQSRVEPRELDQASYSHLREVIEREQTYWETVNQPRLSSKDMDSGSFATTSIWMERTRWQDIYKGARRDILRASTRLPDRRALEIDCFLGQGNQESDPDIVSSSETEQKISCILGALDIVVDRCEDTISQTSRFLLCWLNSTRHQHFHERPFSLVAERSTEKKYRNVQKRLLAFAFRAYMMTDGVRSDYVRFQLSEHLSSQLQAIWEHKVWQLFDWSRGSWPMVPGGSEIGEATDEASVRPAYQLLQEEIIPVSVSQSKDFGSEQGEEEAYSDDEDEDTDSVFSYDEVDRDNSEFGDNQAEANESHHANYPMVRDESNMAMFIEFLELLYQLCLTICTERFNEGRPSSTLLVFFSGILGFSQDCKHFLLARQFCPYLSGLIYIQRLILMERALPLREYGAIGIPRRPYVNQLDQLNSIRERYMIAGTQHPLAEMTSLRDFGRNIARTEPPSILFSWSDDGEIIRYGDFQLTMDKFRQIPDYFISRAEEICNKLMFDIKPDIDLAAMKDDMVNMSSGYSFVKHPANDLDKAYLDLLYSAYASRESNLSKGGRWRWKSMDLYLKQVTKLEEMLAGGLYTACGQTPRARDLFTLACESGPSTSCSISIWNGLMGYVLRHHKAKRQMGREFYVVRFLPSRLAYAMYNYLVYVRRFAALLRREQQTQSYPYYHERLLFHNSGKPWCTSRLTSILKQATSEIWQREFNIRIFRQIAISITEKHVREIHSPLNIYDDTTADADLNAALAWQSGHRPLQRGITYGLDGAFPNRLQPALLRSYEWASTRWHEFICQPSRVVPSLRKRNTPPSNPSLSIATLKRDVSCMMQNDESLEYCSVSTKKRKESDTMEALKNVRRANGSSPKSKEANCGPSVTSASSQNTPHNGRLMCDNPYFTYEEQYKLLGCRLCATMVTRQRIKDHLRGRPHHLNGSEIKKVQEWASQLELINDNQEISGLRLPPDDTPAIEVLGPPKTGGFRCTFKVKNEGGTLTCRFVGSDKRRIREHLKHEHGWDLGLKRGKASAATNNERDERPWKDGVFYQRLFQTGPRSEFFEVLSSTYVIV
ncbi:hypothetical protein FOQG_18067 [Fusarium oxysporum f. sp. raphani 54005]|uniref:C2H2-type domain-containing protein n=1 Tax=Fusarium oxysporum f. sp. raphani 54005 TaxID=1089458 RepID=X0B640_FUSOX|nr:hypothetical protein FOQG_18067 [Fusarium oxysporum f. sp. raphani 54005]